MEILVLMKLSEAGVGANEEQNKEIVERKIVPSLERLMEMKKEGILSGGFFAGQRSAAFIFTVQDEGTLDKTMAELPFSDIYEVEMVSLESIGEALERDRDLLRPVHP